MQSNPLAQLLILTSNCLAVDFETFQRVLNRPGGFRDPGEPEEYCRGFQVFDKDMTGYIGVGQLKYILTNLGEKMTDDEVEELLKAVDTSSGQVNYTGGLDLSVATLVKGVDGTGERSWENGMGNGFVFADWWVSTDLVRTILAN